MRKGTLMPNPESLKSLFSRNGTVSSKDSAEL